MTAIKTTKGKVIPVTADKSALKEQFSPIEAELAAVRDFNDAVEDAIGQPSLPHAFTIPAVTYNQIEHWKQQHLEKVHKQTSTGLLGNIWTYTFTPIAEDESTLGSCRCRICFDKAEDGFFHSNKPFSFYVDKYDAMYEWKTRKGE